MFLLLSKFFEKKAKVSVLNIHIYNIFKLHIEILYIYNIIYKYIICKVSHFLINIAKYLRISKYISAESSVPKEAYDDNIVITLTLFFQDHLKVTFIFYFRTIIFLHKLILFIILRKNIKIRSSKSGEIFCIL